MVGLWLVPSDASGGGWILDGRGLAKANVHPLRTVYLGRFGSAESAAVRSEAGANRLGPESVLARNVRMAVDHGQTRRYRLSAEQVRKLRAGEIVEIEDGLGRFAVGYSRMDDGD